MQRVFFGRWRFFLALALTAGGFFLWRALPLAAAASSELIITVDEDVSIAADGTSSDPGLTALHAAFGIDVVVPLRIDRAYQIPVPDERHLAALHRAYAASASIRFVQENATYEALFTPNDANYNLQWNFSKVRVAEAWDRDTTAPLYGGDPSVIVAVVDTGVAYENFESFVQAPDLAGTNFVAGYDFINNDAHANDDHGHGTHVAGTIAQTTNNGSAVAGIAFNATVMPVKVLNTAGTGTTATVAQGIDFARQNGADVINLSLGTSADDPLVHSAIQAARDAGMVIVAAAGNSAAETLAYPARYEEVIAVAATRFDDGHALYSNVGPGLDLSAPGGQLYVDAHYTTDPSNTTFLDQNTDGQADGILQETCSSSACTAFNLYYYEGTSQAAPHVAAAAALLLAAGVSPTTIQTTLQESADDLGASGYDATFGYGRLNIAAAFDLVAGDTTPPDTPTITGYASNALAETISQNTPYRHTAPHFVLNGAQDSQSGVAGFFVAWSTDPSVDPQTGGTFQTAATFTADVQTSGTYTLAVRSLDNAENVSARSTFTYVFDVTPPSPPTNLQITPNGSNFLLTWAGSTESGVAYHVYKGTTSGPSAISTTTAAVSLADTDLTPLARYYYTVSSLDALGNESARSSEVSRVYYPSARIVTGPAGASAPHVRIQSHTGTLIGQFFAYDRNFRGGINLAAGDVDGSGTTDMVVGTRSGSAPHVRVFDASGRLLSQFFAFLPSDRQGVSVAVGDIDGDGVDDILTAPQGTGGASVRVYAANGTLKAGPIFAYGTAYRGGINLAAGDVDGDGTAEILTIPSFGAPHVRAFTRTGAVVGQFFAYPSTLRAALSLAAGDVDGDGRSEVVVAPGPGTAPHVRLFRRSGELVGQFFAYDRTFRGGVTVTAADVDGDGSAEIMTGTGPGSAPHVRLFRRSGELVGQFFAFPSTWRIGVTVSAAIFP